MRTLIFNTEHISFARGVPSDAPPSVQPWIASHDTVDYRNVAVALTCVEHSDAERDLAVILDELLHFSHMVGRRILLVPFVHLTSHPAPPSCALTLLQSLSARLVESGLSAGISDFGFHQGLIAEWVTLASRRGDVAFRDSRFPRDSQQHKDMKHA